MRYCGGNFTDGALWDIPDVTQCNFSDIAMNICSLNGVSYEKIVQQFYIYDFCMQLPLIDVIEDLQSLTSDSSAFGSTEVTVSVAVLMNTTDELKDNTFVRNTINF